MAIHPPAAMTALCDDMDMGHPVQDMKKHAKLDCHVGCTAIGEIANSIADPVVTFSVLRLATVNDELHGLRTPPVTPPPRMG
jgi:hypothetical protein